MPDISLCQDDDCPSAKTCYRHEAKPGDWQTYGGFKCVEGDKCEYYWPMSGRAIRSSLNEVGK